MKCKIINYCLGLKNLLINPIQCDCFPWADYFNQKIIETLKIWVFNLMNKIHFNELFVANNLFLILFNFHFQTSVYSWNIQLHFFLFLNHHLQIKNFNHSLKRIHLILLLFFSNKFFIFFLQIYLPEQYYRQFFVVFCHF